jgi:hypothetical protein
LTASFGCDISKTRHPTLKIGLDRLKKKGICLQRPGNHRRKNRQKAGIPTLNAKRIKGRILPYGIDALRCCLKKEEFFCVSAEGFHQSRITKEACDD